MKKLEKSTLAQDVIRQLKRKLLAWQILAGIFFALLILVILFICF